MVTIELDPVLLIATAGLVLAVVSIALSVYFGRRLKRTEEGQQRTEEKLDSTIRVRGILGKTHRLPEGGFAKEVRLPNGRLGLNITMVAEPGVIRITGLPANFIVSEPKEEEGE